MSEFVMVPRDLLEKAAGMVESYSACVAAYVKADDLERWDYVPGIDDCAEDLRAALAAAPPSPPPSSVKAREIDAFEAGYIQGHDATVEGRYVDPSDAATDYLAALSAPEPQRWRPIDEAPKDGTPLRLFAESLIDEDFNPSGSAEGHWCDDVGWQAALWNDGADEFYTAVIYPSHFMTLPETPQ